MLLTVLTVLSACTDTAPCRAVTLHPVADNLLSANRDILSVPRVDQDFIDAQPFAAANERAQRVFGREKGSELEAYGDVASAEILSTGHVVLLDRRDRLIRVVDESDVGVAAGGLGQGPGEFVEPITLFSHRDSLFVLDRARAVHVFAMPEGSKPAYARTVRLPFEAEDACRTSRGLLVLAPPITSGATGSPELNPAGASLHRLDGDGLVLESFHVPYRSTSPAVVQSLYAGRMLCSPADGTITVAYSSLGEVHHLSADGDVRWITRLPNHSYPPLREDPNGTVGPSADVRGAIDQVRHIARYGDSLLVVSVTSTAVFEPGRPTTTRLGVMRRLDGAFLGYYTDETVAGLIYGDSEQFLLYRDSPHPAVTLRRVPVTPAGRAVGVAVERKHTP